MNVVISLGRNFKIEHNNGQFEIPCAINYHQLSSRCYQTIREITSNNQNNYTPRPTVTNKKRR